MIPKTVRLQKPFCAYCVAEPSTYYNEENRAWQGAPSIARTHGGRLYLSFMSGGIYEPDPRNYRPHYYSDDNGETWNGPFMVLESDSGNRMRVSDGSLWTAPDGRLWMFWVLCPYADGLEMPNYTQKMDMENDSEYHAMEAENEIWCSVCENPDEDELRFTEARFLFRGQMINKPFVTASGAWLIPCYLTPARSYFEFYRSEDCGKTFTPVRAEGRALQRAFDEPSFYQVPDGRIAVAVRTREPRYLRMFSSDDGKTWSAPEIFMEAASQRPQVQTVKGGASVLVTSVHSSKRNGMRLLVSEDGIGFTERLLLDDRERVSYPDFDQAPDGTLFIAYDRERNNKIRKSLITQSSEAAKEILFARVSRRTVESGEMDEVTVRARVISKAKINELNNRFVNDN